MKEFKPYEELFDTNPLLRLVVPLVVGIGVAGSFPVDLAGCGMAFFILSLVSVLLCIIAYRIHWPYGKKTAVFTVCSNLCLFFLGAGLIVSDEEKLNVEWPETPQNLKVMVLDTPKQGEKLWQTMAAIVGGKYDGQKIRLGLMKTTQTVEDESECSAGTICHGKDSVEKTLLPGDVLLVHAKVNAPKNAGNPYEFDYERWLRNQSVVGTAFCFVSQWKKSELDIDNLPLNVAALRTREVCVRQYERYFEGRNLGILAAMTLGDKTYLDGLTRDVFSYTGVSHILALSGMHLGILFLIYQCLVLYWCKRRWVYVTLSFVGIFGLWVFALLAGLPISLLRASIMFTLMQVLACLRHDSFSLNNLSFAALGLLLFSPKSLFDVGFQLSFLSVSSLILLGNNIPCPKWCSKSLFLKWVFGAFVAFFCAQLATAPLVAYYFHTFPVYGLFANLVAVPMTYMILVLAVLFFAIPFLQVWTGVLLEMALGFLGSFLTRLSDLPGAVVELYPSALTVGLTYLLIICIFMYVALKRIKGLYVASVLLLCIGGNELYLYVSHRQQPQMIFYNLGRVPVVHAISSAESSYLWSTDFAKADSSLFAVKRSYWKAECLACPLRLDTIIGNNEIYFDGRLLCFNGWRVALCNGKLPVGEPEKPIEVDYLLIARGCRDSISHIFRYYSPEMVVLDASLTDYYRKKYKKESATERYKVHDVAAQGALTVF